MNAATSSKEPEPPHLAIRDIAASDEGLRVVVRLKNPSPRALHYIGDVRMILYDAATHQLRIRLSDVGRVVVAGIAGMHPAFRVLDPAGEAELALALPPTIVRIAPPGSAGELRFEEHDIREATDVVVEIGWSDIPFYDDPREASRGVMPAAAWERGTAVATAAMPGRLAAT